MSDLEQHQGTDPLQLKWFAESEALNHTLPISYINALDNAPRKVDVLIRFDNVSGEIHSDLLSRLAQHPKVGTIIIYGLPKEQQISVAALAVIYKANVRFCDNEDEVHVLMNKRRSRLIVNKPPNLPLV
jgi:hypothetical protein